MHDLLEGVSGERMPLDTYLQDFDRNFWAITEGDFWKLERQQTFQEPKNESWTAFARGDWDEALRLNEASRDGLNDHFRKIAGCGFSTYRVRVVEEPITPYLLWELHVLRLRDELGESMRIVGPEQVERFETRDPLPEIYTLGTDVMYEAVYNDEGVLVAGIRYDDRDLVARCRSFIQELYAAGEPLARFFEREVAGLEPSRGG